MKFSNSTIKAINSYVYRLIDPRNGQTFYVGKGKGNRVFQHAKGILKRNKVIDDGIDSDDSLKLQIIQRIKDAGLDVIYVIQRWNLTDKEAIEVEAALIDAYPGLSNIQSGHGSEYGAINAEQLENMFTKEVYNEPTDFKYMIIKVKQWRLDEMTEKYDAESARYEATRGCWRISLPDVQEYPYVFSVSDGIVKEVYKVFEWHKSGERKEFTGVRAEENIRSEFIGKRIPDYYRQKGMASPVLYSKQGV